MSIFDALTLTVPTHSVRTMSFADSRSEKEVNKVYHTLTTHTAVKHAWFTQSDELFIKTAHAHIIQFPGDPFVCLVKSEQPHVFAVRVWV